MNRDAFELREGERVDELERNDYGIIQDPKRFCFGMDAVLLSGFARVRKGDACIDLGTGTGIIPILLEAKTAGSHFTGLEIQEASADMARRSVAGNHLTEKIDIVTGDIKEASEIFGVSSFDVVTVNPPYMEGGRGLKNENEAVTIARHEILCNLDDILRESSRLLKTGGRFFMVHRPNRLAEIMCKMCSYKLEPKRMKFVQPFIGKKPNMILIEGILGAGSEVIVEEPIIVYDSPGHYTPAIYEIYGY